MRVTLGKKYHPQDLPSDYNHNHDDNLPSKWKIDINRHQNKSWAEANGALTVIGKMMVITSSAIPRPFRRSASASLTGLAMLPFTFSLWSRRTSNQPAGHFENNITGQRPAKMRRRSESAEWIAGCSTAIWPPTWQFFINLSIILDSSSIFWRRIKMAEPKLSDLQRSRIERNRQRALMLRNARLTSRPYPDPSRGRQRTAEGEGCGTSRLVDTGGGFLLEQDEPEFTSGAPRHVVEEPGTSTLTLSVPRVIDWSNLPCCLNRYIAPHSMKNLALHQLGSDEWSLD